MRYTAGELAKKLGVSARTVRFYDEKKLLRPCEYSEAGYRLYDEDSVVRLQKILMLKYMDFSLEQISEMMRDDSSDMQKSLKEQEALLLDKKEHITRLINAIRKTNDSGDEEFWDNLRHVIELTRDREEVIEQYKSDTNLKKRISIHDYSTADTEWFHWLFEREQIKVGMKILDIGCGAATFWSRVADLLPKDLEIHLVDYSDGMLASARNVAKEIVDKYPEKNLRFVIEKRDAADFSYPTSGFDLIMANHMLYHVARESRLELYKKIKSLLAKGGRFSCTLIGQQHMRDLHDFIGEYYPSVKYPSGGFDIWLETAKEELDSYFNVVSVEEQKNDLYVPDEELILNYVASYSEEASKLVNGDKESFYKHVQSKMDDDGYFFIHKSTGVVMCTADEPETGDKNVAAESEQAAQDEMNVKLPERLERTTIYESDYACLYTDKVRLPSGHVIDKYHQIHYPHEAVSIVIFNEKNEILMIREKRYTVHRLEWEIPAGRIEDGETKEEAARREAMEETGCTLKDLKFLGSQNPTNGMSDCTAHVFAAKVDSESSIKDVDEVAYKQWMSVSEVKELLKENRTKDGISILAILFALEFYEY